jgi:hypothetical protein
MAWAIESTDAAIQARASSPSAARWDTREQPARAPSILLAVFTRRGHDPPGAPRGEVDDDLARPDSGHRLRVVAYRHQVGHV